MKRNSLYLTLLIAALSVKSFSQQAVLTIVNKSNRSLTVKLMKGPERKAVYIKTDSVAPKGTKTIFITETGQHFIKSQAILFDKKDPAKNDTLYSKDAPFMVLSDKKRGYSNIIYEYIVEESKKSQNSVEITKKEYGH